MGYLESRAYLDEVKSRHSRAQAELEACQKIQSSATQQYIVDMHEEIQRRLREGTMTIAAPFLFPDGLLGCTDLSPYQFELEQDGTLVHHDYNQTELRHPPIKTKIDTTKNYNYAQGYERDFIATFERLLGIQ